MLNDSEFNDAIEATFLQIEDALDNCATEIDYEMQGGVLTLSFVNGSKIIVNTQKAAHQLWIAAKSGGFHLDYDEDLKTWKTDSAQGEDLAGELLTDLLPRLCTEQAGETVELDL